MSKFEKGQLEVCESERRKMNAVIYARFSPRRNSETCESIETQIELCKFWCEKQGHSVVGEHSDHALSGSEEDRPGLWDAIESLKRNMVLVVYRLDRLARSVYLSYIIEQAVHKRGAKIVSTSGEGTWQDTPEDELVRRILQALNEYERKVIAARTKASMLRHQANGRRMSDKTPFGMIRDPDDHLRMVECPEEQEIISKILQWHEAGQSFRAIARTLEDSGILCRDHAGWHHSLIQNILKRQGAL
jgi:site-specific DNA recombinase